MVNRKPDFANKLDKADMHIRLNEKGDTKWFPLLVFRCHNSDILFKNKDIASTFI